MPIRPKKTLKSSIRSNIRANLSKNGLNEFSISRLIPNIATVAALCTGLSAIRFALLEHYEIAAIAIIVAALLDSIDGRLARLLKATSQFGAELDSLADFINFGVAPPVVLYILTLHQLQGLGWGIVLFFSVCMGLRLARFNVMNTDSLKQNKTASAYFVGVPAPAGAFIALLPLMLTLATKSDVFISPYITGPIVIVAGLLLISRFPTYSFKTLKIQRDYVLPTMVLAGLLVASIASIPWITASAIILAYIATLPFSYRSAKNHQQEA